ncbi:hypothetical protein PKOR_09530 [Pontibacter korlensis]|uniref:DUF5329 domain-containing protein n=2 Tax=Pontibacter korlensis TaxID=400092 RepID=A0A0E3ZHP7_9BACT|nr:hypothetical protein PKOR_09530 [Pontibacter korlensis]
MKAYVLLNLTLCAAIISAQDCFAQANTLAITEISANQLSEDQKVAHLIQVVSKMEGAMFIRNGSEHSCRQAAEHLESKWEKHRNNVKTAQGFIEELASRSGLTGEPYKIRFADGSIKTTNEVLLLELKQLEQK